MFSRFGFECKPCIHQICYDNNNNIYCSCFNKILPPSTDRVKASRCPLGWWSIASASGSNMLLLWSLGPLVVYWQSLCVVFEPTTHLEEGKNIFLEQCAAISSGRNQVLEHVWARAVQRMLTSTWLQCLKTKLKQKQKQKLKWHVRSHTQRFLIDKSLD